MTRNIGSEALTEIAEIWRVDENRSVWRENGFDWWPGDFKVSASADGRMDGHGPETWMLSIRTDFLKDVPIESDRFVKLAAMSSRFFTSTHAWVYPPAEVWANYKTTDDKPQLWLANTAYLTSENVDWLPGFLARMSIMQPINAQVQAFEMPKTLDGGIPNASRPEALVSAGLDEILEVAARVYVPIGDENNRWIGTNEFRSFADDGGKSDLCFGFGDEHGLTLETPFGDDSALIRLMTDQRHPQLGNGLLGTLQLPFFGEPKQIADECAFLNLLETMWTDIPQFGCWHPHSSRGNRECAAFSSFIPNAVYGPGVATQMAIWLFQRARWVHQERWPELKDKPMLEIITNRMAGKS